MPTIIFSNTKKREQEYLSQLFEEKEWFKREHFPVFFLIGSQLGSQAKINLRKLS